MSLRGKKRIALGIWSFIILVVFFTYLEFRTSFVSDVSGGRIAVEDGVIDPEIKGDNLTYDTVSEESLLFKMIDILTAVAVPLAIYAGKKQIDNWADRVESDSRML